MELLVGEKRLFIRNHNLSLLLHMLILLSGYLPQCSWTATKWTISMLIKPLVNGSGHMAEEGDVYDCKNQSWRMECWRRSSGRYDRDYSGGPAAKMPHSQCGGPGSISGQGTRSDVPQLRDDMPQLKVPHTVTKRSCMPQWRLKIPCVKTKTWHSQIEILKQFLI